MRPNPCVKAVAVLAALTFGGLAPAIPPPTAAADDGRDCGGRGCYAD